MRWVKTLPCAVCGRIGSDSFAVEAAHTGPRGLSQKADDSTCVPLCLSHHRSAKDSHHTLGKRFGPHHGINLPALVERLNRAWELLMRSRNETPWS